MKKNLLLLIAMLLTSIGTFAVVKVQGVPRQDIKSMPAMLKSGDASFSMDDITNWTGTGSKKAAFVVQWNFDNEYVSEKNALVFGYRFDDDNLKATDMIVDIVKNNPRLYMAYSPSGSYGAAINGIGYDANDDGYFFVYGPGEEPIEFDETGLYTGSLSGDQMTEVDPSDYWRSGWYSGYWSLFDGNGANNLGYSSTGASGIAVKDGTWVGFNFCYDMTTWTPPEWKPFVSAPSNSGSNPFADIVNWTGTGENQAAVTIQFNDDNETNALIFGYRFDGETTGAEMLKAIVENNPRLYALMPRTYSAALYGLGWDFNDNQYFGLELNGTEQAFKKHIIYDSNNSDNMTSIDTGDLWRTGWMSNGFWAYFTKDDATADYEMSMVGYGERKVVNGSWDAWYFDEEYATFGEDPDWKPAVSAPVPVWRPFDISKVNTFTFYNADAQEEKTGNSEISITFTNEEKTEAVINDVLQKGVTTTASIDWKEGTIKIAPFSCLLQGNEYLWIAGNKELGLKENTEYDNFDLNWYNSTLASSFIEGTIKTVYTRQSAEMIKQDDNGEVNVEITCPDIVKLQATVSSDKVERVAIADRNANGVITFTHKASSGVEEIFNDNNSVNNSPVVSSIYYNSLGQRSFRPYQGLNIVVNRHADGSITTTKQLF